ncbi:MAG: hypothetical protein ACKO1F_00355 [Flammeovirgaceae bacterium]
MIKPILYHNIEDKNRLERGMFKALMPKEAFVRALEVMDLMIQLRRASGIVREEKDDIDWIVLPLKKDK